MAIRSCVERRNPTLGSDTRVWVSDYCNVMRWLIPTTRSEYLNWYGTADSHAEANRQPQRGEQELERPRRLLIQGEAAIGQKLEMLPEAWRPEIRTSSLRAKVSEMDNDSRGEKPIFQGNVAEVASGVAKPAETGVQQPCNNGRREHTTSVLLVLTLSEFIAVIPSVLQSLQPLHMRRI